jgi:hypothetical protein
LAPRTARIIHYVRMKKLAGTLLLLLVAVDAAAGVSYRLESSTGNSGHVISEGMKLRLEMDNGSVLITSDGGKTLTILNPASKTFSTMGAGELVGLDVAIANPKTTARDLGDGGVLEGYSTRKWSVETSFDATIETFTIHVTMLSESWRTERLPEAAATILAGQAARTGIAAIDKLLESMASAKVKGFPLKETTTIRTKGTSGAENSVTSTVTVHDVRRVATKPAQFVVPAGYKRNP